ncbi:Activating signal cointegrator 1 [Entophlyctis sp. JEL0112]|nr:Activating signal cointegrator 1 [Entophlyctis sp. JEL0112]
MGKTLSDWASSELARLLGLPGPSDAADLTTYVLQMSPDDAAAHLSVSTPSLIVSCSVIAKGLLGTDESAIEFITQFALRRAALASPQTEQKQQNRQSPNLHQTNKNLSPKSAAFKDPSRVYRKKDSQESYLISSKISKANPAANITPLQPDIVQKKPKPQTKKSYVPTTVDSLVAKDRVGNLVGLNGRLICECLGEANVINFQGLMLWTASKHSLLCNCLTCGKIICNLEGPGPCPSCGSLVESALQQISMIQSKTGTPSSYHQNVKSKSGGKQENNGSDTHRAKLNNGSSSTAAGAVFGDRGDESLFPSLMSEKDREALQKAEENMNRLLEYQRNSTARTRVHDTASDFDFQSDSRNTWLSPEERLAALKKLKEQEQLEESRRKSRVISINLQNKTVTQQPYDHGRLFAEEIVELDMSHIGDFQKETKESGGELAQVPDVESESSHGGSSRLFQNPSLTIAPRYIPISIGTQTGNSGGRSKMKKRVGVNE